MKPLRIHMKRPQKKTPSDYPQFAFRMKTFEEKVALEKEIEQVQDLFNNALKEEEKSYKKNEIILEALRLGLTMMRRKARS